MINELCAWATQVVDYYSTKSAIRVLDRDKTIQDLVRWGFEKMPKYEDAIAEGREVNARNFFMTIMACYMVSRYRKKKAK